MSTIFLIIFLFFSVGLIIGLIKPSVLVKKGEAAPPRKKVLSLIIPMLIFFILFAVTKDDPNKPLTNSPAQTANSEQVKPTSPKPKVIYSLNLSPDEFKDRFNQAAQNSNMKIANINIENGDVQNTFNNRITNNINVVGVINKSDNSVRNLIMIGAGDGTPQSGADVLIAMGLLIASANPELIPEERFKILQDIGLAKKGDNLPTKGDLIRHGRKYSFNVSKDTGIQFTISDPNDK